jgi:hypothetical protein
MGRGIERLVKRGWDYERVLDMTLPEFFMWTHCAVQNMVQEAEILAHQIVKVQAPLMGVPMI